MRQIVLDTETTGRSVAEGHRIIEIGCVELINRRITNKHYHQYLKPGRKIDAEALDSNIVDNSYARFILY